MKGRFCTRFVHFAKRPVHYEKQGKEKPVSLINKSTRLGEKDWDLQVGLDLVSALGSSSRDVFIRARGGAAHMTTSLWVEWKMKFLTITVNFDPNFVIIINFTHCVWKENLR